LALLLSASVQTHPSEMMVTNGPGTDRCGPWLIERAIRDVREQIDGLPEGFSFHDLRHYLASLLIASGADIKTVQARMRHASARTTLDTYGHLWPDADESTRGGRCHDRRAHQVCCVPTAYRGTVQAQAPQVRAHCRPKRRSKARTTSWAFVGVCWSGHPWRDRI
jgi:Phage integrase family